MSHHRYTQEQLDFIRDTVAGRSFVELTVLFNKKFGTDYPVSTVTSTAYRYGCRNGRDTRLNKGWEPTQFKKGHVPHNKGKRIWWTGGEDTQFKPGGMPKNYRPVGSERINADGYVEVKVADPRYWKGKHIVVWEAANGPVPKGHAIIFADGDRLNITLDNLLLVSRRQLAVLNKRGLLSSSPEASKTGIIIADIYLKIGERKRESKRKKRKADFLRWCGECWEPVYRDGELYDIAADGP